MELERVAFLSWHWRIKPCRNDSYRNENSVAGLIAAIRDGRSRADFEIKMKFSLGEYQKATIVGAECASSQG
tara:strand:+ start:411 stop:626 length:216 start_codon:yes stop_codon:yes gene_type:complete